MASNIKSITNPRLHLNVLSDEEVKKLHQATLDVIEQVGVKFPSEKALRIWKEYGATVDMETRIVKAGATLVEKAIAQAPKTYKLAARIPEQDLELDGNHVYLGTDGCGVEVIDLQNGIKRRSSLKDVAEIARVADGVEQIAFNWTAVSAQDFPAETRSLHELGAIWQNSSKHLQTESIVTEREARAAVEMAAILAGGRQALKERPLLSIMQCTASPLGQDGGSLDAALVAAEARLPVGFMTMVSCGTTGPATPAGSLVVGNAEVLSALALIQLAHPGAPVFYAAAQTATDMRTGGYTGGGPEDFLFGAATNRLADFYGVPLSMGAFATGAKEPNWQAGIENSLSSFMASISMSDMLLGAGLLHGSRIWSFEQMLMDCEIFDIVCSMMKGIPVDDEGLAIEVIRSVGQTGNYLAQKHTRTHGRELWRTRYMDRRPYETWQEKQDGARDWARVEAQRILSEHHPLPLDEKLAAELELVISKA